MNNKKKEQGNLMYQFSKPFTYWTFLVGHEKPSKNVISWTMNYRRDRGLRDTRV
jgi:hypothetical protein